MFGNVKPPRTLHGESEPVSASQLPPAPSEFLAGLGLVVRSNEDRRRLACAVDGMNHQAVKAERGLSRRSVSIAGTVVVGGTEDSSKRSRAHQPIPGTELYRHRRMLATVTRISRRPPKSTHAHSTSCDRYTSRPEGA